MNKRITIVLLIIAAFGITELCAQGPKGGSFGFGIIIGEPTGLTGKIWTAGDQALAFSLGTSYLGKLRIGVDYLWHFDAFKSRIVKMYAGPGLAVGFGESGGWVYYNKNRYWYKDADETGFGVRGVFGINIIPRNAPVEIFGELGVMIGLSPLARADVEGAIGIRFYP
jgi:hypothetical protein